MLWTPIGMKLQHMVLYQPPGGWLSVVADERFHLEE
jgi:hypothetical protein